MRAEPDKVKAGVVGLAIDQNEVGPDVAVAVRLGKKYQNFCHSGARAQPAPAGRPGMTDFGSRRILAQSR